MAAGAMAACGGGSAGRRHGRPAPAVGVPVLGSSPLLGDASLLGDAPIRGNPSLLRDAPLLGRPPGAVVAAGGSARRARTRRPVETVRPRWLAPTVRQPVLSAGPAVRRAGSRAARRRS